MNVRYRPMRQNDICQCVEHLAVHPVLGPRYGKLIEELPSAIRRALGYEHKSFLVFEEFHGGNTRFVGAGMAVFVTDDFLREAKITPYFWIGPELVKRINGGQSPILTDSEVRNANSTAELNLMVWHNTCHPQEVMRPEVATIVMTAFEESHRGFQLREIFSQADSVEQLRGQQYAGGLYFNRLKGCYAAFPDVDASNFSDEPRNVGITRKLALERAGSWLGSIFIYGRPQFGFSLGEQRLLLSALNRGGTDEELSKDLGISVSAVKQTWRLIYDKVAACQPEFLADRSRGDTQLRSRGREKKGRLVDYLRGHPEELRPVSRKLLRQGDQARL
jgi:hypothetical protein